MQDGNAYYRLGVSLLALTLIFLGVQSIQWSPAVNAQVTTSAMARIVSAPPKQPQSAEIIDITQWGYVISEPGTYRLASDLSGTSGVGITIASANVVLLGDGHAIIGDGVGNEFPTREIGVSANSAAHIKIAGIRFRQLDMGIRTTVGPTAWHAAFDGEYDTTGGLEYRDNQFATTTLSMDFWNQVTSYCDTLILDHNQILGGSGGVVISNDGILRTVSFIGNEVEDVEMPFYLGNYMDADVSDVTVSGNQVKGSSDGMHFNNPKGELSWFKVTENHFEGTVIQDSLLYSSQPYITFHGSAAHVDIAGNTIQTGPGGAGLTIDGTTGDPTMPGGPVTNVKIYDNRFIDSWCDDCDQPKIEFRNLSLAQPPNISEAGQITLDETFIPQVRNNILGSNSGPGVAYYPGQVDPVPHIDARYNWWGDPAGPNGPHGTGVSGDVLFEPWLTSPPILGTPTPASRPLFLPVLLRQ